MEHDREINRSKRHINIQRTWTPNGGWVANGVRSLLIGSAFLTLSSAPSHAAGTIAGTIIENTAQATYTSADGSIIEIPSNIITITVDELLDINVVSNDPGDIIALPGVTDQILTFQIANIGNGQESYRLTADTAVGGDDFDPALQMIVLDTNDNGVYDPGIDTTYVMGANDPDLAPDESVTVFIITTIPSTQADGERAEVSLIAEANTGTGIAGTSFDGQGQGGGDAVVGSTGAIDESSGFFTISKAQVTLVKTATVLDPFGGTRAVPGSVITYNLVATISGSGTLTDMVISDPIPASTKYVPASTTLETVSLTDASDADAGAFDGSEINIDVGDVAAGETRTVTFEVTIQ